MSATHGLLPAEGGLLAVTVAAAFVLLLIGFVLTFSRIVRGPSLADRVVALDLLNLLVLAFIGLFAIASGEAIYLDLALALALVGFLGTVAFARYAERRTETVEGDPDRAAEG